MVWGVRCGTGMIQSPIKLSYLRPMSSLWRLTCWFHSIALYMCAHYFSMSCVMFAALLVVCFHVAMGLPGGYEAVRGLRTVLWCSVVFHFCSLLRHCNLLSRGFFLLCGFHTPGCNVWVVIYACHSGRVCAVLCVPLGKRVRL